MGAPIINLDEYPDIKLIPGWVLYLTDTDGCRTLLKVPQGSVREERWKDKTTLRFGPPHRPTLVLESRLGVTRSLMAMLVNGDKVKSRFTLKASGWQRAHVNVTPPTNDQFTTVGGGGR